MVSPPASSAAPKRPPSRQRIFASSQPCSMEYFTRKAPASASARPPIQTKMREPRRSSSAMPGRGGFMAGATGRCGAGGATGAGGTAGSGILISMGGDGGAAGAGGCDGNGRSTGAGMSARGSAPWASRPSSRSSRLRRPPTCTRATMAMAGTTSRKKIVAKIAKPRMSSMIRLCRPRMAFSASAPQRGTPSFYYLGWESTLNDSKPNLPAVPLRTD